MKMTVGLVRAAQILSTQRAREADLAVLLAVETVYGGILCCALQ